MAGSLVNYVLFFGGMGLLCFIMLKVGHYYWSNRLKKWAADQGLKLVDFRGAKFYEGPSAWIRSDSQHLFRVHVEDKQGKRSSAWVMFGTFWGFTLRLPVTRVIWDDSSEGILKLDTSQSK
jgi:hypothetical protein